MTYRSCKRISVLLCAVFLMFACTVSVFAENLLGDADSSGQVTVIDVTCIQRKLAGIRVSDSFSESAADVDGNGVVEITDATYIQRWLADMDTPYPIGPQPTEPPTQRPTDADGWGTDIFRP